MTLDPVLYNSLANFRLALRQFLAFSEAAARDAGITPQQYQALLVIKTRSSSGIIVRDLAEQMLMHHHGAVQMVDRLAAADLVERRRSSLDGRQVLIVITRKGKRLLEHLAAAHIEELLRQEPLLAESLRRLRQMND